MRNNMVFERLGDRYSIQSLLGRQTGHRTFLATDLQAESLVVIKLLLFGTDFIWDDLKLFERETEILKSLDHPAIPKYLDFFDVDTELGKGWALVQTYIEARSLQEWVQSGRSFSEEELQTIAKELLEILDYLHHRQPPVIHRDIKPSNILLGSRSGNSPGQVYLVDFGSVQSVAQGGTVTIVGTYGYMPPEQFGGRAIPASDLYSVGTTLIYLAAGQHPADLPQKNLQVEFEQYANLGRSFTRWIRWLTHPDLSKRPTSAKEAIKYLQEGSTELPNQRFFLNISRPLSDIKIEKTSTTFEMIVPSSKLMGLKQDEGDIGLFLISLFFFGSFLFTAFGFWWAWLVFFFLLFIVICLSSKNEKSYPPYKITLQGEGESIFVDVALDKFESFAQTSKMKLRTLSAGPSSVPNYVLFFYFQNSQIWFSITGNRTEIQWLCDELNEWTGLEIIYGNYTPSK